MASSNSCQNGCGFPAVQTRKPSMLWVHPIKIHFVYIQVQGIRHKRLHSHRKYLWQLNADGGAGSMALPPSLWRYLLSSSCNQQAQQQSRGRESEWSPWHNRALITDGKLTAHLNPGCLFRCCRLSFLECNQCPIKPLYTEVCATWHVIKCKTTTEKHEHPQNTTVSP